MVLQNMSSTEDKCAFSGAVMSTELKSQLRKEDKVFLKRPQLQLFVREKGKLYLNTNGAFQNMHA